MTDVALSDFLTIYSQSGGEPRALAEHIRQHHRDRFRLTYMFLKWMTDEEREVLDDFERDEPKELGAERAVWLCLAALLWPARRPSPEQNEAFFDSWIGPTLTEITKIGLCPLDDIDKCAIVDSLLLVKSYWANSGFRLFAIDGAIAAIAPTLPDNEVIAKIKSGWPEFAPAVPASTSKPTSAPATMEAAATSV